MLRGGLKALAPPTLGRKKRAVILFKGTLLYSILLIHRSIHPAWMATSLPIIQFLTSDISQASTPEPTTFSHPSSCPPQP